MSKTPCLLRFILAIVSVTALLCLSPALAQQKPAKASGTTKTLPQFKDYPAESFTGKPAKVNLASHPDARMFWTALTAPPEKGTRFAGHYRIVAIGCGTNCGRYWAVDLIDGVVHSLFLASYGVAFRPDSRLIVANDPAEYEALLKDMSVQEVEDVMKTYGPPVFWVEEQGKFKKIGPTRLGIDPVRKQILVK